MKQSTKQLPNGRKLLVIHGDQFDVISQHHRWLAFLGDIGYRLLLAISTRLMRLQEKLGSNPRSLSAWLKYKIKRAVNFISKFEVTVAAACAERDLDGVVCGHVHHAESRRIENIEYLNCGDWVESCTALLEDASGAISIYRHQDADANIVKLDLRQEIEVSKSTNAVSDQEHAIG